MHGLIAAVAVGCIAGDNRIDPADLELRDLLGVSPDTALAWDPAQRAAAREVLAEGLRARDEPAQLADDGAGTTSDDQLARSLAASDARRAASGVRPVGLARIVLGAHQVALTARQAPTTAAAITGSPRPVGLAPELWLAESWDREPSWRELPGRGRHVLAAAARDAGHTDGPVVVVPVARLAVIAVYVAASTDAPQPRLAVNPVLLAALEPGAAGPAVLPVLPVLDRGSSTTPSTSGDRRVRPRLTDPGPIASTGGNPYSFYGSVAECASAQRTRCAACLSGSACAPITDAADGDTECTALDADAGRGYFLLCINLSLAITSVERCTGAAVAACPRDRHAADSLTTLENNAEFLADPVCGSALDTCLAEIYGAPDDPFPGLDGGPEPADPPRSTTVNCGDSCGSKNTSCEASPRSDCSGPSCNNSLSCDSECSSSNDQSGCGGDCNACSSSGGGDGGGGGSCSSDSGSSGNGCSSSSGSGNSSCGGDGCGGGSSSSGCGGGSDSSSGCGGSDSSSGCGGSDSSSGCGGSSNSSGCGGSKCSVARNDASPGIAFALSVTWGILPVPFAALIRRRARRRRTSPVAPPDPAHPDALPGSADRCRVTCGSPSVHAEVPHRSAIADDPCVAEPLAGARDATTPELP